MALKLEFSASFKDADTTLKILNELNKEMHSLAEATKGVGGEGVKAFEEMKKQFEGFEKSTYSIKALKDLNSELKQLTAMKGDMSMFTRSFSDLGRAMNQGLGLASDQVVSVFKRNLETMKTEAQATGERLKSTLAILDDKTATTEQKAAARLQAGGLATELAHMQSSIKAGETDLFYSRPRGFLGGASVGGVLSGMATAGAVAGTAGQAYNQIYEGSVNIGLADYRAQIKQRQLRMQASEGAIGGQPTTAMLQALGIGEEQKYQGSLMQFLDPLKTFASGAGVVGGLATALGAGVSIATGGLATVPVMALLGGLGLIGGGMATYKTPEEHQADRLSMLRNMDMGMYSKVWEPGLQRYNSLFSSNKNLLMSLGDTTVLNELERLNKSGVVDARAVPVMAMLNRYGRSIAGKDNIYRIQQDLGLGEGAMTELIRAGGTNAQTRLIDYALGASGLTNREARAELGEAYSDVSSLNAGGLANMEDIYTLGNAATQGANRSSSYAVPDIEKAQVARAGLNRAQSMWRNASSLGGAALDNKLIQLGISDPMVRQGIAMAMQAGQYSKVNQLIAKITGRSASSVAGEMQNMRTRIADTMKQYTSSSPQAEKAWRDVFESDLSNVPFSANLKEAQAGMGGAVMGAVRAQADLSGGPATADTQATMGVQTQEAEAKMQSEQLKVIRDTTDKLGVRISDVIAKSFINMGTEIRKAGEKAGQEFKDKNPPANGSATNKPR